jgi:hypothetical protein
MRLIMGAQIIKRVVGEIPEIIDVCGNNTQVSYNSYGHYHKKKKGW